MRLIFIQESVSSAENGLRQDCSTPTSYRMTEGSSGISVHGTAYRNTEQRIKREGGAFVDRRVLILELAGKRTEIPAYDGETVI